MARVFAGNEAMIDREVLDAIKRLPHDFVVFAEFDIERRNIDWLIIRVADPADESSVSAAILTELKRISAPITGTLHDEWKVERIDGTTETVGGGQEKNPYWQAVGAANALRGWLWNHQRLFCEEGDGPDRQESNFSVWPDVLLLPRHGQPIDHRLPVRPTTGYGMWWFDLERWMNHVATWRPNQRERTRRFTERELLRLAELLDTHEIYNSRNEAPRVIPAPAVIELAGNALDPLNRYLKGLEERIGVLTARVASLEERLEQHAKAAPADRRAADTPATPAHAAGSPNGGNGAAAGAPPTSGAIPEEQAHHLADIARGMALAGRRAVFPAVLKELERRLGYSLKQTGYHGFGGARAYFDAARAQGVITYGPDDDSGAPTILPSDVVGTA